jgi:hypothetical protein
MSLCAAIYNVSSKSQAGCLQFTARQGHYGAVVGFNNNRPPNHKPTNRQTDKRKSKTQKTKDKRGAEYGQVPSANKKQGFLKKKITVQQRGIMLFLTCAYASAYVYVHYVVCLSPSCVYTRVTRHAAGGESQGHSLRRLRLRLYCWKFPVGICAVCGLHLAS